MRLGWNATSGEHFIRPILDHLSDSWEIVPIAQQTPQGYSVEWPMGVDCLWLEWADEVAARVTNYERKVCPIIVRLHSFEVFTAWPGQIKWENVDACIFVADHIRDYALSKWPEISEKTQTPVIPNALDLKRFNADVRLHKGGNRIAWVGDISHKKGPDLFVQAAAVLCEWPETEIHVVGEFQDERFRAYHEHILGELGLGDRIVFRGKIPAPAMPDFYRSMDFVLSTSPWESFQYGVAEGIACGCTPLVHDWPGASDIYGTTWRTLDDLRKLYGGGAAVAPVQAMQQVRERFSSEVVLPKIRALIDGVMEGQPSLPTVGLIMIAKGDDARLDAALGSCVDQVDETVVLLDRRSGTALGEAVCAKHGVSPYLVYPELYDGHLHFSEFRNTSIALCKSDWCFVLDADEVLEPSDSTLAQVAAEAERNGCDSAALKVKCYTNSGLAEEGMDVRLFKRGGIQWKYPVHNQLHGMENCWATSISIRSSYEGDSQVLQSRGHRAIPALQRMWRDNESDEHRSHAAFFLCRMYAAMNRHRMVIKWAKKNEQLSADNPNRAPFWRWWALSLMCLNRTEEAEVVLARAAKHHPQFADIWHTWSCIQLQRWHELAANLGLYPTTPMASRQHVGGMKEATRLLGMPLEVYE